MTLANAQEQYVKIPYFISSKSGKNWQKFIYVPKEANYICLDVIFIKKNLVTRTSKTPLPNFIKMGQKYNERSETSFMPSRKVWFSLHRFSHLQSTELRFSFKSVHECGD